MAAGGKGGWAGAERNLGNNALSSKRPGRSQVRNKSPRKGTQANYIGDRDPIPTSAGITGKSAAD